MFIDSYALIVRHAVLKPKKPRPRLIRRCRSIDV